MQTIYDEVLFIVEQYWKQQEKVLPSVLLVGFHPSLQDVISNVLIQEGRYRQKVAQEGQDALDWMTLQVLLGEPLPVILLNLNQSLLGMENMVFLYCLHRVLKRAWMEKQTFPEIIGVTHEDIGQKELASYKQLGVKHVIQPFRVRDFRRIMQQLVGF